MLPAVFVDDFQRRQFREFPIGGEFARPIDDVVEDAVAALKGDVEEVVLGIISDPDHGQPIRLNLVAKVEGRDLDFHASAFQRPGYELAVSLPFFLFDRLCHMRLTLPFKLETVSGRERSVPMLAKFESWPGRASLLSQATPAGYRVINDAHSAGAEQCNEHRL